MCATSPQFKQNDATSAIISNGLVVGTQTTSVKFSLAATRRLPRFSVARHFRVRRRRWHQSASHCRPGLPQVRLRSAVGQCVHTRWAVGSCQKRDVTRLGAVLPAVHALQAALCSLGHPSHPAFSRARDLGAQADPERSRRVV